MGATSPMTLFACLLLAGYGIYAATALATTTSLVKTRKCQKIANIDISFALDMSGNVGKDNFATVKKFVVDLVDQFTIGKTKVRVAVVTFGDNATLQFDLDQITVKSDLENTIRNIQFVGVQQPNLAAAFDLLRTKVYRAVFGGRAGVPNKVVLITPGGSGLNWSLAHAAARKLKTNVVRLLAVAPSKSNSLATNLVKIVSYQRDIFSCDGFSQLSTLVRSVAVKLECADPTNVIKDPWPMPAVPMTCKACTGTSTKCSSATTAVKCGTVNEVCYTKYTAGGNNADAGCQSKQACADMQKGNEQSCFTGDLRSTSTCTFCCDSENKCNIIRGPGVDPKDPCASSPCENGAACLMDCDGDSYLCVCPPGYFGDTCNLQPTTEPDTEPTIEPDIEPTIEPVTAEPATTIGPETQAPTSMPETQPPTIIPETPYQLNITGDDEINEIYFDGIPYTGSMPNRAVYNLKDTIEFPSSPSLIAVKIIDKGGIRAVTASDNRGHVTDSSWKCTAVLFDDWMLPKYDDSAWPAAVPQPYKSFPGIDPRAQRIWSDVYDKTMRTAYCRFHLVL